MEILVNFKQEFENLLEGIYLGKIKEIKGDGGYINLIKIKTQFYSDILKAISQHEQTFKYENGSEYSSLIYEHIYKFFDQYLNNTGTPFYPKSDKNTVTFAHKNYDVSLFYKTQDLYYIKSEKLFEEMSFNIDDSNITYIFNVDNLSRQESNEKLKYKFMIDMNDIKISQPDNGLNRYKLVIKVMSDKSDNELFKNLIDIETKSGLKYFEKEYKKINKYYNKASILEAIRKYKRQSEIDYFIHKNAKIFLEEQLSLYMYNAMGLNIITEFTAPLVNQYKDIKKFATLIISYISKFENELKTIWEKPKLVKNSNYIITIDKLTSKLVEKIREEQPQAQKKEWFELGFIDETWIWDNIISETAKTLPIDTKYISASLKYDILATFENLDECIDGVLIKSDNYQALNTIKHKYFGKIDMIYIDPPFNTGKNFAYKDAFHDSTWIMLMENRLDIAKNLLSNKGSFYLHLDDNSNYIGRQIMNHIFGKENFVNEIIWNYVSGGVSQNAFARKHDCIFLYRKTDNKIFHVQKERNKQKIDKINKNKIFRDEKGEFIWYIRPDTNIKVPNGVKSYLDKYMQDVWAMAIVNPQSIERLNFNTQKPEALLERIIKTSSNANSIIMDYFSGSGTTINTAHKLGRKWIGVEMGSHFYDIILPRIKKNLFGKISGISKELLKNDALKIGGIAKYYELESYDEVLKHVKYNTHQDSNDMIIWDEKLSDALVLNDDDTVTFDFSKISGSYKNFSDDHSKYSDIAETLSNLLGAEIVKIDHHKLTLKGIDQYFDMDNLNFNRDESNYIKSLVWWKSI